MNTVVMNKQGQTFPFRLFAQQHFSGQAPQLIRWKGFNSNVVKADVKPGFETASMIKSLISQHENVAEKHQITLEFGAEAEESSSI